MSSSSAPASGTLLPGAGASIPTDRVVQRTVPATVVLRLTVVVAGLVVVAAGDVALTPGLAIAAALLALHSGALAVGGNRPAAGPLDVRLARDAAVSTIAVLASGGWWSPFGAVLAVDLALIGLARGYRRAFPVALAVAAAGLVVDTDVAALATAVTPLPVLLVLGAALGGFAHGLTADGDHEGLGHAVHLADANRAVTDLHTTLRALPTAPDAVTVSRASLDWLRPRLRFQAAAVIVRTATGAEVVHAEGASLTDAAAAELLAGVPAGVRVDTATGILDGSSRLVARVPLELRGRTLGVLVVEDDEPARDEPEVRRVLSALADPLAVALDTARWFSRLATLSGELERTRVASDLSDRLCQSMASTVFALDLAAARNGDRELFSIADAVRADVADLRRTLDDLRAAVDDDPDLAVVVAGCVERAAQRSGFLPTVAVDAPARAPRTVEQQLLRSLQELLAAVSDATAVDVSWHSAAGSTALTVRCDGRLSPPDSVLDRADAIGAVVSSDVSAGVVTLALPTTEVPS